jgi:tetratricopeptide (TPR) repeat protein
VSSTDFAKQARVHFDRGAFQEAATVCRRGLLANPGDVEARVLLGRALMALQRYGEVLAEMRVLLDREPGHPAGMAIKGEALLYKGDVTKALQALRDAQTVAPHDPAIRALRERAEHAAASDARGLAFVDEDPSANETRHYPSRPGAGPTMPQRGGLGGDAAELFDNLLGDERKGAAPAAPRGAAPPARPGPPGPPRKQPPPAAPAPRNTAPAPRNTAPAPRNTAPAPRNTAPAPRNTAPAPRNTAPAPRNTAPAPRNTAPAPAAPPPASAAGSSSGLLPEQSGSFDEPTAIYGPGDAQLGSKAGSLSAQLRKPVSSPGPRASQPDHLGSPAASLPSVQHDSVDAAEFEDDMAPTSMIDVDRSLRVRPDTSTAPNAQRYSTQAPTDEDLPPALPSVALPPTSSRATLAPRSAPPPPRSPAAQPPPAPGSPMARAQAAAAAPGRVVPAAAATSPEMPAARAAAAEARRAPPPAPAPRPPAPERPALAPESTVPAFRPPPPERLAPQPLAPARRPPAPERPFPVLQAVPAPSAASQASHDATIAVPRQSRQQSRAWQYLLVALVVIAGGAVGGLQLRKVRLDWEIDGARRSADVLMASDTYAGYLRARNVYRDVLTVRSLPGDRASLARAQAALAAEFDEGYGDAQAAVQKLEADAATVGPDALLARAYLALAERDAAGATVQIDLLAAQVSEHPFASYLTGRARLLTGDAPAALDAFRQAAERVPRPMFLVWLGHAHRALGQEKEAAAAFARVLTQVPDHPAALLGRAELAATGLDTSAPNPSKGELEAALEALIAEGARPLAEQATGVSSGQMARAALALVALRTRGGDQPGARRALQQLQGMRREGDPDFAVILAQAQAQLGDTDAALAELATVVDAWPTRLDARVAWAELALRAGNLDAARKALIGVQGMDSVIARNPRALALRGRTRLALGAIEPALADLDAALALQPDLFDAVIARAEVDLARGDAARTVERLAPLAGEGAPAEVRVVYAAALRGSGQYDQARAVLEALSKLPAAPPRTYLELARIERDQGRWVEARAAYAGAIERLKTTASGTEARIEAIIEAARLALDTGDRTGAREAIAAAASAAASKNDGRVLVEAARIHILDGAHQQATSYLERAEALSSPPAAQLARERGRLALRQGNFQTAIGSLKKARALPGGDVEAMLLLVEAHLAQRNIEDASAARDDYAKRPGMDPAALSMAEGLIAAATGQATGSQATGDQVTVALAAYDKARDRLTKRNAAPRHIAYLDYLTGRTLFEYDRLREASRALERAIRIDPGHADPYFVLGLVEYGDSDYSDAARAFEDALKRDPASLPEAWFYLGEVEVERNHDPEAQKAFRAYLELRPEGAKAEDARRYLDELDR